MFDYMVKILDNGRLLVRNSSDKTSKVLKANEISSYFESALEAELETQKAQDEKIEAIKSQDKQTYQEWYDQQQLDAAEKKEAEASDKG